MEEFVHQLASVNILYVYLAVFAVAYIENIFPPFPSDLIVVFAGSLVVIDNGNAPLGVICATTGSVLGFVTMYAIGKQVGNRVLEKGRFRFISVQLVQKVEDWFRKYGYWIIVLNRFLAGTRAVVSFCAGVSEMKLLPTTILSILSALLWNGLLVYFGVSLGSNWRLIESYLATYSTITTGAVLSILIVWFIVYLIRSRSRRLNGSMKKD